MFSDCGVDSALGLETPWSLCTTTSCYHGSTAHSLLDIGQDSRALHTATFKSQRDGLAGEGLAFSKFKPDELSSIPESLWWNEGINSTHGTAASTHHHKPHHHYHNHHHQHHYLHHHHHHHHNKVKTLKKHKPQHLKSLKQRAGMEMAQWVKCLPCKHRDLSSISRSQVNS